MRVFIVIYYEFAVTRTVRAVPATFREYPGASFVEKKNQNLKVVRLKNLKGKKSQLLTAASYK